MERCWSNRNRYCSRVGLHAIIIFYSTFYNKKQRCTQAYIFKKYVKWVSKKIDYSARNARALLQEIPGRVDLRNGSSDVSRKPVSDRDDVRDVLRGREEAECSTVGKRRSEKLDRRRLKDGCVGQQVKLLSVPTCLNWSNNILHTIVMTQSIMQAGKCFRPTNVFSEQRRSIPIRIFSSKLNNNFDEKLTFLLLTLYRARQQKYIPVRLCLQFYQQSLGISKRNFADMDMKIEIGFISCGRLVCKWKPLPWKIKNKI